MLHSKFTFGKKIPLIKGHIKDINSNNYTPVTLYEYDCKDKEDISDINKDNGHFGFKRAITTNMKRKFEFAKQPNSFQKFHFYVLEKDSDDELVGLCQTSYEKRDMKVMYIEKKGNSPYKYVGQTMLASIGMELINNKKGKQLSIVMPFDDVKSFYIDKCGFYDCKNGYLRLKTKEIPMLINKTEEKVKHKLINIQI